MPGLFDLEEMHPLQLLGMGMLGGTSPNFGQNLAQAMQYAANAQRQQKLSKRQEEEYTYAQKKREREDQAAEARQLHIAEMAAKNPEFAHLFRIDPQLALKRLFPEPKYHSVGGALVPEPQPGQTKTQPVYEAPEEMVSVNVGDKVMRVPKSQAGSFSVNVSPDAKFQGGVAMRGQNMTDARSRDANTVATGTRAFNNSQDARKEFAALPEVKKFKEVIPVIEAARSAPDTPQGDLALIYGVGKALDPESVVREGEMALVLKSGSPLQRMLGTTRWIAGQGKLTPQIRANLMQMLDQRAGEYATQYDAARQSFTGIVERAGLNPADVFTEIPRGGVKAKTMRVKMGGRDVDAKLAPDGNYYVESNGQYLRVEQ